MRRAELLTRTVSKTPRAMNHATPSLPPPTWVTPSALPLTSKLLESIVGSVTWPLLVQGFGATWLGHGAVDLILTGGLKV